MKRAKNVSYQAMYFAEKTTQKKKRKVKFIDIRNVRMYEEKRKKSGIEK